MAQSKNLRDWMAGRSVSRFVISQLVYLGMVSWWVVLWVLFAPHLILLGMATAALNFFTADKIFSILNYRHAIINSKSE